MRVLVTGGTGTLGRPAVRLLVERVHEVRVLSRQPSPALPDGAAAGLVALPARRGRGSCRARGRARPFRPARPCTGRWRARGYDPRRDDTRLAIAPRPPPPDRPHRAARTGSTRLPPRAEHVPE